MTDLKPKYYQYLHRQDILLVNEKIEEEDILTWEEYQLEYEDYLEDERLDRQLFKSDFI